MIPHPRARRQGRTLVRHATFGIVLSFTVAAVVGCGGTRRMAGTEPIRSPRETVTTFMGAVADSNLTKMAQLWGSSKGSAAATGQPTNYEHRIVIIQSYLRHDDYRIVNGTQNADRWDGQVELRRQACTWTVPFSAVDLGTRGWVINSVDLTRAGNPVRPCNPSAPGDSGRSGSGD